VSPRLPRVPGILLRALDVIHPDAVAGDLLEEYVEHIAPHTGPLRARFWLWRHLLGTIAVGFLKSLGRRRRAALDEPAPAVRRRGTPRREIMGTLWSDIRYGIRMLLRTPVLSLAAVTTIALGIGLTTHTFSVVYGAVLKGLPYEGADRLVNIDRTNPSEGFFDMSAPIHDFVDWREQQTVFEDLAASRQGTVNIADVDLRPQRYDGAFVTAATFSQVGVQPILGRTFQEEDDTGHTPPTIILGYDVWQTRYGGDPDIIGRTVRANARPTTVIGVMPPKFRFPFAEDVWMPMGLDPVQIPRGEGYYVQTFGRLRPGVSIEEAQTQMAGIAQRLAVQYPETNEGISTSIEPYTEEYMPQEIVAVLYVMLLAVFGVLLIACANVSNLLLARSTVRAKEIAIRSALGANRSRVIRQLLVESTLLSLLGGAAGIVLAYFGIEAFNALFMDMERPYWIVIALYQPVLFFAIAITVVAALVSGTVPAFRASGAGIHELLKDESRGSSSFRMGRFSAGLVVGEIAVSCALLVAAGMMAKSVINLKNFDMGFETEDVFTARVGLFEADYPTEESWRQFFDRLVERLQALPGVQAAALTTNLPMTGSGGARFAMEGETYEADRDYPVSPLSSITPGFFETFGAEILEGRDFSLQDRLDAVPVAIVNESFARRYLPDGSPVGRRLRLGGAQSQAPWLMIVGVAPDFHIGGNVGGIGDDDSPLEMIYTPVAQGSFRFMSLAIKAAGDPLSMTPQVRDAVAALDPNLPIYWAYSMDQVVENNTWAFGLFGTLFGIFGGVALFMAAVGLYGVMAFSVSRRTQEMGIRMALGAYAKNIVGLVLKRGFVQLGIGMAIGLGIGAALSRPLQLVLFDVNPNDPLVYGGIVVTLGVAGMLACWLPARRATRVDLVDALRPE
jgi:putative ABC transport system permease protein